MMRFGIPEYRLPRSVIRGEIDKILSLGVTLRTRAPLTPELGLAELRREGFEAFFLSVGVQQGRDIAIPGVELDGVVKAIDYLLNANRGYRMDLGRRVVVIGGGFVAFDAARTALRVGREEEVSRARRGPRGRVGRAPRGGARLRARRGARRRHRGDHRLAGELRGDARPADRAGPRGVRGGEEGGHPLPAAARAEAVPRDGTARGGRAQARHAGLRRGRPLLPGLRRRGRRRASRRTGACSPSGSGRTCPSCAPRTAWSSRPAGPCRWTARRSPPPRRASSRAATWPSGRATSSRRSPTASAPRAPSTSTSPARRRGSSRSSRSRRSRRATTG